MYVQDWLPGCTTWEVIQENEVRNLSKVEKEIKTEVNTQREIRDIQRMRGHNETKEQVGTYSKSS